MLHTYSQDRVDLYDDFQLPLRCWSLLDDFNGRFNLRPGLKTIQSVLADVTDTSK